MLELLKEVGRGKRGAKDLTYEQALQAAEMIRTGKATSAQIGAFLMAERIKTESMEEILAFIDHYRQAIPLFSMPHSLDCAGPYDGRRTSFYATFPTAFVLAACGQPVTLHSSPTLPPKWGIALYDLLLELGLPIQQNSRDVYTKAAEASSFLFAATEQWHPDLQALRPLRLEIGVRTVYNTVEKLLRFSDAPYMAIGVYHGTVFEKVAQLLLKQGITKGIVVQGLEGSEDVSVQKPTRTLLIQGDSYEPLLIDPEALGLKAELPEIEWTPRLQLDTAIAVLKQEAALPYRNMVLLNSALRLWVTGTCATVEEGLQKAQHTLGNGLAWRQFQLWLEQVHFHHAAMQATPSSSP